MVHRNAADIRGFPAQRDHVGQNDYDGLTTPKEDVYPVVDQQVAQKLGVDLPIA
jgi:hypothetical protein